MSGDQLNLDEIEDHANKTADQGAGSDPHVVLALVAEVRRLRGVLDEIVHTLGPDRVCDCPASIDCGLTDEATEALTLARVGLGLDP